MGDPNVDIGNFFMWNGLEECLEPFDKNEVPPIRRFKLKSEEELMNIFNKDGFFDYNPHKKFNYCCFIVPFHIVNAQLFTICVNYISKSDLEIMNTYDSNFYIITHDSNSEMRMVDNGGDSFFLSSLSQDWIFELVDFDKFMTYHNCYTISFQQDFVEGLRSYVSGRGMKEIEMI